MVTIKPTNYPQPNNLSTVWICICIIHQSIRPFLIHFISQIVVINYPVLFINIPYHLSFIQSLHMLIISIHHYSSLKTLFIALKPE